MNKDQIIRLRVTPENQAAWRAAAAKDGITLSEYIRRKVDNYNHERHHYFRDFKKKRRKTTVL